MYISWIFLGLLFILTESRGEWDSSRSINFECTEHLPCQVKMGHLSMCNLQRKHCECFDTQSNGKKETVLYHGRCYHKKAIGDYCDFEHDECKASLGNFALCEDGRCIQGSNSNALTIQRTLLLLPLLIYVKSHLI